MKPSLSVTEKFHTSNESSAQWSAFSMHGKFVERTDPPEPGGESNSWNGKCPDGRRLWTKKVKEPLASYTSDPISDSPEPNPPERSHRV